MTNSGIVFTTESQKQFAKTLCDIAAKQKINPLAHEYIETTYSVLDSIDTNMRVEIQEKARDIAYYAVAITEADKRVFATLEAEVLCLIIKMIFADDKL